MDYGMIGVLVADLGQRLPAHLGRAWAGKLLQIAYCVSMVTQPPNSLQLPRFIAPDHGR